MHTFCLLFSYLIKVVALLIFICCYQHVLVNKDIHISYQSNSRHRLSSYSKLLRKYSAIGISCHSYIAAASAHCGIRALSNSCWYYVNNIIWTTCGRIADHRMSSDHDVVCGTGPGSGARLSARSRSTTSTACSTPARSRVSRASRRAGSRCLNVTCPCRGLDRPVHSRL